MSDKFQASIQATVRLDVQVFGVGVRDVEQLLRIAVDRTAVINFELNAEMTQALSVENKVWRITVLVNNFAVLIPAGCAVGVVVIIPSAVTMNDTVAVLAADAILIKAVVAKRVRVILNGVFLADPLGTVVADYGQTVGAILAEPIAFHFKHLVNWMLFAAICTNSRFTHCLFLHFVW